MIKRQRFTVKAKGYTLNLGRQTYLMGIINMTPDSFSHDGCLQNAKRLTHTKALSQAKRFIKSGADILDIGGESSRPGAPRVKAQEEKERVVPLIRALARKIAVPISIDTYKPSVAQAALDAGASIVNYIQGANPDGRMLKIVKDHNAAIILMHMRGNPRTMQKQTHYTHFLDEIVTALTNAVEKCLEIGINSDRIIIDPGIGFGKTCNHNLQLINRLDVFQKLNQPILMGPSRKSFIGHILDKDVDKRLYGTLASVSACVMRGAHIIRVHDIKESKDVVRVTDAILDENFSEL